MVLFKPENTHVSKVFSLTGKVAAVTGGARGIGLEVSRGLAEAGADVIILNSYYFLSNMSGCRNLHFNQLRCRGHCQSDCVRKWCQMRELQIRRYRR